MKRRIHGILNSYFAFGFRQRDLKRAEACSTRHSETGMTPALPIRLAVHSLPQVVESLAQEAPKDRHAGNRCTRPHHAITGTLPDLPRSIVRRNPTCLSPTLKLQQDLSFRGLRRNAGAQRFCMEFLTSHKQPGTVTTHFTAELHR